MSLRFIYQHSHFDDAFLNPKISGEGNILASGWSRLRRMEKLSCFNSSQRSNDRQKPISYPDGTWGDVNIFIEGSLNRNFRQYGELKSSSRVVKSVDRRCNSQKVRRKKIHPRKMLEKSRNAVLFHRFVCRVSPKVGLLKRRVRR